MAGPGTIETPAPVDHSRVQHAPPWIVIVYDNDKNTFEEVIEILMIATQCTVEEAEIETWEVHHLGKSVVHLGAEDECNRVADVIRTIGLRVDVREEA